MRPPPDRIGVALVLVALIAANLVNHLLLPGQPWPGAIGLVLVLAGVAAWTRMSATEVGLDRADVRGGLRWGGLAAIVIVAAYAIAWSVPAVLSSLTPSTIGTASVLVSVLVVIPLTTVLPEELAFRGVLLGLLGRSLRPGPAAAVSSVLFGLWHVLAARSGTAASKVASDSATGIAGNQTAGGLLLVAGTVLATTAAGFVLCWLRFRGRSLLAPIVAHWALNACGALFAQLA